MEELVCMSPGSRQAALGLKGRKDVQKLAKEAGLKANGKTVDIVTSLLHWLQSHTANAIDTTTAASDRSVQLEAETVQEDRKCSQEPGQQQQEAGQISPGPAHPTLKEAGQRKSAGSVQQVQSPQEGQPDSQAPAEVSLAARTVFGARDLPSAEAAEQSVEQPAEDPTKAPSKPALPADHLLPPSTHALPAPANPDADSSAQPQSSDIQAKGPLPCSAKLSLTPPAAPVPASPAAASIPAGFAVPRSSDAWQCNPMFDDSSDSDPAPVPLPSSCHDSALQPAPAAAAPCLAAPGSTPGSLAGPSGFAEESAAPPLQHAEAFLGTASAAPGTTAASGSSAGRAEVDSGSEQRHEALADRQLSAAAAGTSTCLTAKAGGSCAEGAGAEASRQIVAVQQSPEEGSRGLEAQDGEPEARDRPVSEFKAWQRGRKSGIWHGGVEVQMQQLEQQWEGYKSVAVRGWTIPSLEEVRAKSRELEASGFATADTPAPAAAAAARRGGKRKAGDALEAGEEPESGAAGRKTPKLLHRPLIGLVDTRKPLGRASENLSAATAATPQRSARKTACPCPLPPKVPGSMTPGCKSVQNGRTRKAVPPMNPDRARKAEAAFAARRACALAKAKP